MSDLVPVAFYAPLKSPDHPFPSGDRTMARLLLKALRQAGFAPQIASELRTWDGVGDIDFQHVMKRASENEAQALIGRWSRLPRRKRPQLWFTYHVYYKAPDWIGPKVADVLGIPYAVAEGSRARKRAQGPWKLGHEAAEAALDRADIIFALTPADREAVEAAKPDGQVLHDLPPFLDLDAWDRASSPDYAADTADRAPDNAPRLLTVAMMREGDKLASYRILAEALHDLAEQPWTLDICGDGERRPWVEELFEPFGRRVRFHGRLDNRAALGALYRRADLMLWPAVNEAYGMALLEAQAFGCPVVAGAYGGVASVLEEGRSGLLTKPGDAMAFAGAVKRLLDNPRERANLSGGARDFVRNGRTLAHAAAVLAKSLKPMICETAPA